MTKTEAAIAKIREELVAARERLGIVDERVGAGQGAFDELRKQLSELSARLSVVENAVARMEKSADQNRITTPTVIGWILTAVGVLAAITIGLLNYGKK